jgi:hypothetical protein
MKKQGLIWMGWLLLWGAMAQAQLLVNRTLVKFNVSGAVFKNYTVQYERMISKNSSFAFQTSFNGSLQRQRRRCSCH